MQKPMPSSQTVDNTTGFVLMSDELKDRLDPNSLFDDHTPDNMPEDTQTPVMSSVFICGVTLSDDEERLGEVLSLERGSTIRSVMFTSTARVMDDIASASDIMRVRIWTKLETTVFDVHFDDNDPGDQPAIKYDLTESGHVMTLAFEVEADTYTQENVSDDDSQEKT